MSETKRSKNFHDKTGKKYNKLTVLGLDHTKYYSSKYKKVNTRTFWKCKCDCGNECVVVSYNLTSGVAKSCGCQKRESLLKLNQKRREQSTYSIDKIYSGYKSRAKKMDLSFNLTHTEFNCLIDKNCYFCGASPSNISQMYNVKVEYNGIDRLNNDLGYELFNCVPCCKTCNRMKNNLKLQDFYSHIKNIYLNLNK